MKTETQEWNQGKADAQLRITVEIEGRAARVLRAISHLTGLPVEKVAERELSSSTACLRKIADFFPHVMDDILDQPDPATVERFTEALRAFRNAGHVQGFQNFELDLLLCYPLLLQKRAHPTGSYPKIFTLLAPDRD